MVGLNGIGTWISDYIHSFIRNVIIHSFHQFNGSLTRPPSLKLGHRSIIAFHYLRGCNYLSVPQSMCSTPNLLSVRIFRFFFTSGDKYLYFYMEGPQWVKKRVSILRGRRFVASCTFPATMEWKTESFSKRLSITFNHALPIIYPSLHQDIKFVISKMMYVWFMVYYINPSGVVFCPEGTRIYSINIFFYNFSSLGCSLR